jgi:hypothetical protein
MLDPREQKKNGFGAQIAREEERHFAWVTEVARRARAAGDAGAPHAPAATERTDAPTPDPRRG